MPSQPSPVKPAAPNGDERSAQATRSGAPRRYLLYATQLYEYAILRPLQRAIHERGDHAAWFVRKVSPGYLRADERRLETVRAVREYQPDAVLTASNLIPHFFPGVKVEVFHGFNAEKREPATGHFRIRGCYDLYCTQGPETTEPFRELERRHGHFRVAETGWPKLDPLFARPESIADAGMPGDHRPVVLYTSTFTERLSSARPLLGTIRELAGSGRWLWLVNLHPKMDRRIVAAYRDLAGDNLRFVETDDILPLLGTADVMVSDTSSALKEFLTLHKPVVTFRNRRPGPHLLDVHDPGDIERAIERALQRPPELMERIRAYSDHIHPYRDGRSSERVLAATDDFIEHHQGRLARKPVNLWRKLRLRYELGYYGPS